MKTKTGIVIFVLLFLAQMAAPLFLIMQAQDVKNSGETFNFKCNTKSNYYYYVLFSRGELLKFKFDLKFTYRGSLDKFVRNGGSRRHAAFIGYFELKKNAEGFAEVAAVHPTPPPHTENFLKMRFTAYKDNKDETWCDLSAESPYYSFPVDKKNLKPVREAVKDAKEIYLCGKLKSGLFIPEEAYIDGIPLKDTEGLKKLVSNKKEGAAAESAALEK